MDVDKLQELVQWLTKAAHDLSSARCLSRAKPPINDTAVYHCQQAAEKALKAYLLLMGHSVYKTHLLLPLVEQCMEFDPLFSVLRDAAEILTPYATTFRYPGELMEPLVEDVAEALDLGQLVFGFVLSRMPVEVKQRVDFVDND
ncbi:MAG: HEPN domain-containing protein [Deltaproteobacteria bacterium]|nr:HEPN domain-containing protein [Deltaproteobacteria bacterium]